MVNGEEEMTGVEWDVIIPLRGSSVGAKTRLVGQDAGPGLGRAVAFAFASDVIDVVKTNPVVAQTIVLTAHEATAAAFSESGITTVLDSDASSLNASISTLSSQLRQAQPTRAQAVLVADLPSLTANDFAELLNLAEQKSFSVLSDKDKSGTCFLSCTAPLVINPSFGPNSYQTHIKSGFIPITPSNAPSIWTDVDTPTDLEKALRLGVGVHTAQLLAHLELLNIGDFGT